MERLFSSGGDSRYDKEKSDLLMMAAEVLYSDTEIAANLAINIEAYHHCLETDKQHAKLENFNERTDSLNRRLDRITGKKREVKLHLVK